MKTQCATCNSVFSVPEGASGKKGKCPKCGSVFTVKPMDNVESDDYAIAEPTKSCPFCGETILEVAKKCKHCGEAIEDNVEKRKPSTSGAKLKTLKSKVWPESRQKSLSRIMPMWVWYTMFVWIAAMVVGLTAYLGFRDTWERDNSGRIKALSEQALSLSVNKNYAECLATYEQLFQLVGDHQLKYTKDLVAQAQASYQQAKRDFAEYEKQQQVKREEETRQEELTLCSQLQYQLADAQRTFQAGKFKEALDQCDKILKAVEGKDIKTREMKTFLPSVTAQRQLAQTEVNKIEQASSKKEQIVKGFVEEAYIYPHMYPGVTTVGGQTFGNELKSLTYTTVQDNGQGRYTLKGVARYEEYSTKTVQDTDQGMDTDTVHARQSQLIREGYEYVPHSDDVEQYGREYRKTVKEAKEGHFGFTVTCSYRDTKMRLRLDQVENDGRTTAIDKETHTKDSTGETYRKVLEEADDPQSWSYFEAVVKTLCAWINTKDRSTFVENTTDIASVYTPLATWFDKMTTARITDWCIVSLENEVWVDDQGKKTSFMRTITYFDTGGRLTVYKLEYRYDEDKRRWLLSSVH